MVAVGGQGVGAGVDKARLRLAVARVAFGREADGFMRQCACGVWHADQGLTPLHVDLTKEESQYAV